MKFPPTRTLRIRPDLRLNQAILQGVLCPAFPRELRESMFVTRCSSLGIEKLRTKMHIAAFPLGTVDWAFFPGSGYSACEVVVDVEVLDARVVLVVLEGEGNGSDGDGFAFQPANTCKIERQ